MPVAAVVSDKILCMHGGLSPDMDHLSQILDISRPTDIPDEGLLCDLLWSDPDTNVMGWGYNIRGVSYTFGQDIISDFLERHGLDLICRAHQVVEDGMYMYYWLNYISIYHSNMYLTFKTTDIWYCIYLYLSLLGYEFHAGRQLITIFSAPNYCGEFDNAGAMMCVPSNLVCSFKIVRPMAHKSKVNGNS